jgi:hypothetical protein
MRAYKCISNNPGYHLTIGKIYLVEKYVMIVKADKIKHLIINDKGFEHFIFDDELQENFIDIEEVREEKLNQLGI